jgi:hypothetical protein
MADIYFYDSQDSHIVAEARRTGAGDQNLVLRGVSSYGDVLNELDVFIRQRRQFNCIFFSTHGSPGSVYFANGSLNLSNAHQLIDRSAIFGDQGRVLFMGCNCGDDDIGWRFMEAVGHAMVQNGFVGASNSYIISARWGLIEPRLPAWGLLRIVQFRDGNVIRRAEVGSLLAHTLDWLFG